MPPTPQYAPLPPMHQAGVIVQMALSAPNATHTRQTMHDNAKLRKHLKKVSTNIFVSYPCICIQFLPFLWLLDQSWELFTQI